MVSQVTITRLTRKLLKSKETTDSIPVEPLYALENGSIELNQSYEDKEKNISLSHLLLDDVTGQLIVSGEVTFKQDYSGELKSTLYRTLDQFTQNGNIEIAQNDFFGGIPVPFTITFETEKIFGDDLSSEVYLTINDALFSIPENRTKNRQTVEFDQ